MKHKNTEQLDINRNTPGAELYLGLVAPVGVDLSTLTSHLNSSLARLNYRVHVVKLSDWLLRHFSSISKDNDFDKLMGLMKAGSKSRQLCGRADFLALAGIFALSEYRTSVFGTYGEEEEQSNQSNSESNATAATLNLETQNEKEVEEPKVSEGRIAESANNSKSERSKTGPKPGDHICYIFNQLKRPEEVELLRWVYGSSFYLIGAYSSMDNRKKNLARRIETTCQDINSSDRIEKAIELIEFDYSEPSEHDFGQTIQKTYPLADVFFDQDQEDLTVKVNRFIELIFQNPFHSPTKDEQGMCLAKSAAYRSADLARQIGAAITTKRGEVISIGCNEAARPGGGQYWVDDSDIKDSRDFELGYDSNDKEKRRLLKNLLEKVSEELKEYEFDIENLVNKAISKENKLSSADLFDVIEYFRSVHAEMAALMDAARRGISVRGATMYATTFPCHECAKHIVAAGIDRLVYIEPYPKSKALSLFEDAISIDVANDQQTIFQSFVGVAPRRYSELFELGKLKRKISTGEKKNWLVKDPRLRQQELEIVYFLKETFFNLLFEKLSETVKAELMSQPVNAI